MSVIFTFRLHEPPMLVICNDESWRGGKTITNGAEDVVASLRRHVPDLKERRVIYRDTDGIYDELVLIADNRFAAFGLLRARTESGAIEAVQLTAFRQDGTPVPLIVAP